MGTPVAYGLVAAIVLVVGVPDARAASAPAGALDREALERRIDDIHRDYAAPHSPGAIIAVVGKDGPVFQKGYGHANREWSVPWTDEVRYTFFSTSKAMVALALFKLEDRGQIRLDQSIHDYLPDFPRMQHKITIRQLLNHTSGLWQDEALALIAGLNASEYQIRLDELYQLMLKQTQLPYRPGTNFYYNDGGMRLSARILEKATGQSFANAMRSLVFGPAGMERAGTKLTEPEYFIQQASAYDLEGVGRDRLANGSVRIAAGLYENSGDGAGSGTMRDYVAYIRLLRGDIDGIRWIDRLTAPTVLRPGYVSPYRYGFIVAAHRGLTVNLHGGYMGKKIAYVRELDLWVVMMRNALDYQNGSDGDRLEAILDAVIDSTAEGRWYRSSDNPRRHERLSRPGDQRYSASEIAELSGRFEEPVSGMVVLLDPIEEDGVARIRTEMVGRGGHLTRDGDSARRYRSYANGNSGAPDPLSIERRSGELWLSYADWPRPRRLNRLAGAITTDWAEVAGLYRSPELDMIYQIRVLDGTASLLVGPGNRTEDRFLLEPLSADAALARPVSARTSRDPMQVRFTRRGGRVTGIHLDTANIKGLHLVRTRLVDEP